MWCIIFHLMGLDYKLHVNAVGQSYEEHSTTTWAAWAYLKKIKGNNLSEVRLQTSYCKPALTLGLKILYLQCQNRNKITSISP